MKIDTWYLKFAFFVISEVEHFPTCFLALYTVFPLL